MGVATVPVNTTAIAETALMMYRVRSVVIEFNNIVTPIMKKIQQDQGMPGGMPDMSSMPEGMAEAMNSMSPEDMKNMMSGMSGMGQVPGDINEKPTIDEVD